MEIKQFKKFKNKNNIYRREIQIEIIKFLTYKS